MKKRYAGFCWPLFFLPLLSACNMVGEKALSLSIIYCSATLISILMLGIYLVLNKQRQIWYILLFSSIAVVNIGYFCLAISNTLGAAITANRVAYLGSVLLPVSMLMIILKACNLSYPRWLPPCLLFLSAVIFFIAASPGFLTIYYQEVSFTKMNGVGTLEKVYGPWHIAYLFYLLAHFSTMIAIILRAATKKTTDSSTYPVILAIAVFVNIGVWFIEQLVHIQFEFLSISYIITESFLLGLNVMMMENRRLKEQLRESSLPKPQLTPLTIKVDHERLELFKSGLKLLTQTEKAVYQGYINRHTTKEIMAELNITENTLKFHNKNIYGKLGVTSRTELLEIYKQTKNEFIK